MKLLTLFLSAILLFAACSSSTPKPQTPMETLKLYASARKKKDAETMKSLLSANSMKISEDEAKAQNKTIDEVILSETLFSESVTTVEFRNEKSEGENASIEVKNSFGSFDIVSFVKENGTWKIAKDKIKDNIMQSVEEQMKQFDDQINKDRQP
jgi:hypothetical protein